MVLRIHERERRMHLAGVLPVTRPEQGAFKALETRVFYILGGYIAVKHFNERDDSVIPNLSSLLQECDIQISIDYRDTQFSRRVGARHISDILQKWPLDTIQDPFPTAIVGAGRSDVSATVHTLSSMLQIVQVSPHSSAAELDDKGRYPFFARTTPSNAADAIAAVDYFSFLGVTHFAIIYILDSNGRAYNEEIQKVASARGMTVYSIPYEHNQGPERLAPALQRLRATGVHYVFAVIEPATWKEFIRVAIQEQVIDNDRYFWLFHSGMVGITPELLDPVNEADVARAVHGSGVLLKYFPGNPRLDAALEAFGNDLQAQQEFVNLWSTPDVFDEFQFRYPGPNYPQYINYDSVISLGLAACNISKPTFTGLELWESLLRVEFDGASAYVAFDNVTGTRNAVPFQVDNIISVFKTPDTLGFVQEPTALIGGQGDVSVMKDFVFWSNTTVPPLLLPPLQEDQQLISSSLLAIGWALCAVTILLSLICALWTLMHRKTEVVRLSQPFFLYQLCIGTCVMAASIIPMSFQDDRFSQRALDQACMSVPWVAIGGYTIAFSAIFSKSWRINRLFQNGVTYRRVRITALDATWPLVIMLSYNVILLLTWTLVSPLKWDRVPLDDAQDVFGRSEKTFGQCGSENDVVSKVIISLSTFGNVIGLIFTNYQAFKTRRLPTAFNEAFYLFVSNASILEVLLVGIPMLVLVSDNPPANFVIKALMITGVSLCILLPLFIPKVVRRTAEAARAQKGISTTFTIADGNKYDRKNPNNESSFEFARSPGDVRQRHSFLDSGLDPIADKDEDVDSDVVSQDHNKMKIIRHTDYFLQRGLPMDSNVPKRLEINHHEVSSGVASGPPRGVEKVSALSSGFDSIAE